MIRQLAAILALAVTAPPTLSAQSPARAPNVVVSMTDDLGYADLSSYGGRDLRTPNIAGLARDGGRLTDFYANANMCTPTRVGFITERYQQRVAPVLEAAIGNASSAHAEVGLPATGRSLPQLLKNNGYATALIGEWHLGYRANFTPNAHGFDHFLGFLSGYIDFCQHTDGAGAPTSSRTAPPSRERAI